MVTTAIFLGAGASKADNAPLQADLFKEYFSLSANELRQNPPNMNEYINSFFKDFFNIDINNIEKVNFPTFEEVLGMLDLAEIRKETFRKYQLENSFGVNNNIRLLRLYFTLLMARVIEVKLRQSNNLHVRLVRELDRKNLLTNTCFVSTNYDILIDNALSQLYPRKKLDYGIDFINFHEKNEWKKPNKSGTKLIKLHGSLNWLLCPTCNHVRLTQYQKGIMHLLNDEDLAKCDKCNTIRIPIIVPPTFYKDMSNVFLGSVWNKAEFHLSTIKHIIFCGYSFPDADIHIKYLLKRIQTNRTHQNIKITVVNQYEGKSEYECEYERIRYSRFLGVTINYTEYGFKDLATNPLSFWE